MKRNFSRKAVPLRAGLIVTLALAACAPAIEQKQEDVAEVPVATPKSWASKDVRDLIKREGLDLEASGRDKLKSLVRKAGRPDDALQMADLDLNGDGRVSRKEVQFVLSWRPEQLRDEGAYRLETQPRLLPNRIVTGMVQVHVNNPEQVRDPGLLFDSHKLRGQTPLNLGQRDQQRFELFTYANYLPLRQKYGSKPGPDGKPVKAAWYTVLIHNPPGNGPITLTLAGSGHLNQANPDHAERMLEQLPEAADTQAAAERINHPTRSNDADLQYRMLHPEHHQLNRAVTLGAGRSLMLYTRLPMESGLQDYRGQFQFQVQDEELSFPLHLQAAVLTAMPAATSAETGVLTDLDASRFAPALRQQLTAFVEPGPHGQIEHLRQASDLSSPRALGTEMRRRQLPALGRLLHGFTSLRTQIGGTPADLPDWIRGRARELDELRSSLRPSGDNLHTLLAPFISLDELNGYLARGEALAADLEKAEVFDEQLMSRIRGWNAEIKMVQRVLASPEVATGRPVSPQLKAVLAAMVNPLWSTLFTLGRVNGVVRGNQISAMLPSTDLVIGEGEKAREWNYVFNTNPYTTGGASIEHPESPLSFSDAAGMLKQSANVTSPPALSYGNYGVRYRIEGRLRNDSKEKQRYDIRIGSPDELGHLDWRSLFDQTDTLLAETSTRFTGTLRLTLAPGGKRAQSQEFSLIHGRVQAPQSLLPAAAELSPGEEVNVTVELVVPTNSTAPQLLQFHAGEAVK